MDPASPASRPHDDGTVAFQPQTVAWLLTGDAAIRWHVLKGLLDADPEVLHIARLDIERSGWGAQLLAKQASNGMWDGSVYSRRWTSTLYTLALLHWLGLRPNHPQALEGCAACWRGALLANGAVALSKRSRPSAELTAMLVLVCAAFGFEDGRLDDLVQWLLAQQGDDGSWRPLERVAEEESAAFDASIDVLNALDAYRHDHPCSAVESALRRGRLFLLERQLCSASHEGYVTEPHFTRFPFPPYHRYDVLRGLEHFASGGGESDRRLDAAIGLMLDKRRADGTWPVERNCPGRSWLSMERSGPSRWATLRCLRVLRWWQRRDPEPATDGQRTVSDRSPTPNGFRER